MSAPISVAAHRGRRGFALPLAVLVLTLLALLAAAAAEAARASRRASALAEADVALQGAAESALAGVASRWPASLGELAVGGRAAFAGEGAPGGIVTSVQATRLAFDVWWLTAESRLSAGALATEGGGGWGRRRINAVVAVGALGIASGGALVADGSVSVAAPIDLGVDSSAAGCPTGGGDSAEVVVGPSDSVATSGGAPAVRWRRDARVGAATLDRWGSADWATVAASADVGLPAGTATTAAGGCAPGGWGTTGDAGCSATPRVVHAAGDLTVEGGSGAGVLLVDGTLRIAGAFRYNGLVVARGGVAIDAGGSAVTGAVVAGATSGSGWAVRVNAAATLRASRCAVWQALASRAIPRPAPGRWWAELL